MSRLHPNFLEAYLKYTSGHEGTERIHKWSIISVIAATLERRVWLDRGFYRLYPNLYVLIIGRSGIIKKSTSTALAVNLFRELDGARIMSERLTAGSLIQQMQLSGKKFKYQDQDVKQSPCFAYASELAVLMDEVFGSIVELLTTFYDCVPHDPKKAWMYHNKKEGEIKLHGPCLNMLGCSTKAWLKKCIPASQQAGGFASRCIFVVENELPKNLVAWPEVTPAMKEDYASLVHDLQHIHSLVGEFTVSQEARDLFSEWYVHHMRHVVPKNLDEKMIGYMSRKGDHILKIAMVHSAMTNDSLRLEPIDIAWATTELTKLEVHWRTLFDGTPEHKISALPFELRSYLRKRVKVPVIEVYRVFGSEFPGSEIDAAIKSLMGMNEIIDAMLTDVGGKEPIPHLTYIGSDLNLL